MCFMDSKNTQIFKDIFLQADCANERQKTIAMDWHTHNVKIRYYQPQPNSHTFSFRLESPKCSREIILQEVYLEKWNRDREEIQKNVHLWRNVLGKCWEWRRYTGMKSRHGRKAPQMCWFFDFILLCTWD